MNTKKLYQALTRRLAVHDAVEIQVPPELRHIVCGNCGEFELDHAFGSGDQKKCLYGSTYFRTSTREEIKHYLQQAIEAEDPAYTEFRQEFQQIPPIR